MAPKKNDFNLDDFTQKTNTTADGLKKLDTRVKKIEELTEASLLLKMFTKDTDLQDAFRKLIWETIKGKAWTCFYWLAGAAIVIPVVSKLFGLLVLKLFGWDI